MANIEQILKNNTISFFDFFQYLDKKQITLVIPPIQRPAAWDSKKIKSILESKKSDYFGPITLYKQGPSFILLDGQQRVTNFLMMYKLSEDIKRTNIITNNNLKTNYIHAMRMLYGYETSGVDLRKNLQEEDIKSNLKLLEDVGYKGKVDEIVAKTPDELRGILKTTYVSINTIESSKSISNEYDVFIDLNNSGTPLGPSDIIKTVFLKNYTQKDAPVKIDEIWQTILLDVNKAKKLSMDKVLNQYIKLKGTNISLKKMKDYYDGEINLLTSAKNKSSFVGREVKGIREFAGHYVIPQSYSEKPASFPAYFPDIKNGLFAFAYDSGIYKPFNPLLIEFSKKCTRALDIPKAIKRVIHLLYIAEFNKYLNKNEIEPFEFNRPAEVRQFMAKYEPTSNVEKFSKDFFNEENVLEIPKIPFNEKVMNNVIDKVYKGLGNKKYGKSLKLIFDFVFDKPQTDDITKYKANFTTEHFYESIKNNKNIEVQKKNLNNHFVFLLEPSIHKEMNKAIRKFENKGSKKSLILKYELFKPSYYKRSQNGMTSYLGNASLDKSVKDIEREYYAKNITLFVKDIIK